jgi:hypothetical protein
MAVWPLVHLHYIWCFKDFQLLRSKKIPKYMTWFQGSIAFTVLLAHFWTNQINWMVHTSLFNDRSHVHITAGWLARLIYTQVSSKKQTWRLIVCNNQIDRPSSRGDKEKRYRISDFGRYEALWPPDGERCRTKRMHWSGRPPVAHTNLRFVRIAYILHETSFFVNIGNIIPKELLHPCYNRVN